jgi:hypothetical protein
VMAEAFTAIDQFFDCYVHCVCRIWGSLRVSIRTLCRSAF